MVIVVLIVVLAAAAAAGVWISRRRQGDEAHSVEGYQHTLSTLQTIRSRSTSSSVRVIEPGEVRPAGGVGPGVGIRAAGAAGTGRLPPAGTGADTPPGGLVFDDVAAASASAARGAHRRQDRAMSAMNRGSHHLGGPLAAAAAVIVVIAVLVVIGERAKRHPPARTGATATTASTVPQGGGAAGSTGPAHRSGKRGASGGTAGHAPTSTVPRQYVAVASTANSGTYTPPRASYTLTVSTTTGGCWVEIREVAAGITPFAQTLAPGQQESFSAQGEVTVLLGAPTVASVTLDGVPVVPPSGARAPLTLTFAPPTSTTTTVPQGSSTTSTS